MRRGLDLVVRMQLAGGAVSWALRPDGTPDDTALLTGNASLFQALRCGIALADLAGEAQPDWDLAVTDLGEALRERPEAFADRSRYSMDWYYPVLGGAVPRNRRGDRIDARLGHASSFPASAFAASPTIRGSPAPRPANWCSRSPPPALRDAALEQFAAMQHLRDDEGAYFTGFVYADDADLAGRADHLDRRCRRPGGGRPHGCLGGGRSVHRSLRAAARRAAGRGIGRLAGRTGRAPSDRDLASPPPLPASRSSSSAAIAARTFWPPCPARGARRPGGQRLDRRHRRGRARRPPEVTVLPMGRNVGSYARTSAWSTPAPPFVAFADDDSWWAPGDLARAAGSCGRIRGWPCSTPASWWVRRSGSTRSAPSWRAAR